MQRQLYTLNWYEVDAAIKAIVAHTDTSTLTGIYGEPRGGLIPAVMLSHSLGLPLVQRTGQDVLWVDDIVDSRKTLDVAMGYFGQYVSLVCAHSDTDFYSPYIIPQSWIVFPWENADKAEEDWKAYEISRK